jgi:glycosyltransferase involved in cell wall biosynthesis
VPTQELQMESRPTSNDVRSAPTRTVLFITRSPGFGGTEKHLLELLSRLGDSCVRIVILCIQTDPYTERVNGRSSANITIRRENNLKTLRDWHRVFREIKPDVAVFVYGWIWCLPTIASVGARLAGIRRNFAIYHLIPPPVPAMIGGRTLRDVLRPFIGKVARRRLRAALPPRLFDKTICVSHAVRDALVRDYRFPRRKMVTVHNGVSISEFAPSENAGALVRAKLSIRPDEFVLVSSARLSEEKGLDILLLAMSELVRRGVSCKCVMVGDGHLRDKLAEQVRTLGLTHHVFMEGFQEDVKPYLRAGDAFVLTSYREGLPFAVLEAMACGLPCIVTNVGGNAEAVAHNVNGLVVNAGSVDEVVGAISYLMSHPDERARMSRVGRSKVCEEFDIEARMEEIKRLILG